MATILHVDMDAFFAAVEVRMDPSLAGRPVVVGGSGRRGVVAAASYEARAYGVRSAMPASQARRLCPQAVFVDGHYDSYNEVSRQIHEVFQAYTPLVEGIALDEAFLDVSGATALFGDGLAIGGMIRRQVQSELGLAASVGVAGTKFVAKLASEAAKPRGTMSGVVPGAGVVVVGPGEELAFLHPHPVEALWGVGPVTASRLRGLGVTTVGELAAVPLDTMERALGGASGRHLHELAWGRDPRPVQPNRATKSIGHEETYPWDRDDRGDLHREVVRMAESVASRLRAAGMSGRTVILKVRYGDFTTITRSRTLSMGIDTGPAIAQAAGGLLEQVAVDPGVRLLGVSVANLATGSGSQLALSFGPAPPAEQTTRPAPDRAGPAPPAAQTMRPAPDRAGRAPPAEQTMRPAPDRAGRAPPAEQTTRMAPDRAGPAPPAEQTTRMAPDRAGPAPPAEQTTRAAPDHLDQAPGSGALVSAHAPPPEPAGDRLGSRPPRSVTQTISSESTDMSWHEATLAVDRVRAKFGQGAVGPAVLLGGEGLRLKRLGDNQWGPSRPDPPDDEPGLSTNN